LLKIIYTTGLTGFIGQYFFKKIFNDYDVVINFGREKKITIHRHSFEPIFKEFNLLDLQEYPADTLVHLATYYNPNPINISEKVQLEESNYNFPYSLCNILKKYGLKRIIAASSYLQLSDIKHKSHYSKTKCKFINWAKSEFELTEVFLFDTFGNNDQRSKVLDTFIKNSILNYDIQIPLKRVDINLTHVEEVADSLINALGLKAGQYMIMSDNQLTIKELAQRVVSIEKTSTKINATLDGNNLIRRINSFPENIYLNSLKQDFTEQIKTRYDEIRQANSF
jgi:nucleoside-diphosphate-sugar epimerase